MTPSRVLAVLVFVGGLFAIAYSQYSGAHRPPGAPVGSAHQHGAHAQHGAQGQAYSPQDEASLRARAAAQTYFGLIAGGDWGGAWDLWTDRARRTVPRQTFADIGVRCRVNLGVPYVIRSARVTGGDLATVAWTRQGEQGTGRMVREDGLWRLDPDAATLARYKASPKMADCS